MKNVLKITLMCMAVSACGSGSGGGSDGSAPAVNTTISLAGVFGGFLGDPPVTTGTGSNATTTDSTTLQGVISSSGRAAFYTFDSQGGGSLLNIYVGSLAKANTSVSGTLNVFSANGDGVSSGGTSITTAAVSGQQNQTGSSQISGTATVAGTNGGSAAVLLGYQPGLSGLGASLASLGQTGSFGEQESTTQYTQLNISTSGVISSSVPDSNGCTYAGQVSVANPAVNVYELDQMVVTCTGTGAGTSLGTGAVKGTGLLTATSVDSNGVAGIALIFSDGTTAKVLSLTRPPAPAAATAP